MPWKHVNAAQVRELLQQLRETRESLQQVASERVRLAEQVAEQQGTQERCAEASVATLASTLVKVSELKSHLEALPGVAGGVPESVNVSLLHAKLKAMEVQVAVQDAAAEASLEQRRASAASSAGLTAPGTASPQDTHHPTTTTATTPPASTVGRSAGPSTAGAGTSAGGFSGSGGGASAAGTSASGIPGGQLAAAVLSAPGMDPAMRSTLQDAIASLRQASDSDSKLRADVMELHHRLAAATLAREAAEGQAVQLRCEHCLLSIKTDRIGHRGKSTVSLLVVTSPRFKQSVSCCKYSNVQIFGTSGLPPAVTIQLLCHIECCYIMLLF